MAIQRIVDTSSHNDDTEEQRIEVSYLLKDAVEKAGTTTNSTALRDALAKTNGTYVTGNLTFDANRNPIKSAVMMEIVKKDGKIAPVYKATVNP